MSRFPLTVPTASNGALLAHSRKVIVSLKIYHRTQSEYTSLNQDQDIFSSQVCLFMTRHTVAGTVILKKKKKKKISHTFLAARLQSAANRQQCFNTSERSISELRSLRVTA